MVWSDSLDPWGTHSCFKVLAQKGILDLCRRAVTYLYDCASLTVKHKTSDNKSNHYTMQPMLNPVRTLAALVPLIVSHLLLQTRSASAAPFEWTGGGMDDFWASSCNWNPGDPPLPADSPMFGVTDAVGDAFTVNNIVRVNATIVALSCTNNTVATWHLAKIPATTTLRVTGIVTIGGGNETGSGAWNTSVAMNGNGTFVDSGTAFNIGNNASAGSPAPGTLDLSGLDTFVYNGGGTMALGTLGSRSVGNITLAAISNNITAGTINIQGGTGTGSSPFFNLGNGADNLNVGGGRFTTSFQFFGGGGLRLRGVGGTDADRTTC